MAEISNESFVLTLPGKCLDVSIICNKRKKFWKRGGIDGALEAMKRLEKAGLGDLTLKSSKGSVKVSSFGQFIIMNFTLLL